MLLLGLLIIAIGALCQASFYVPIKKIQLWHWESFWLIQGVWAWIVFPLLGAWLAVPAGHSFSEIFTAHPGAMWTTFAMGMLWGVGGLTFGLSMRYLGVALGQSIALGTCAALGTILTPVFTGDLSSLTWPVLVGVLVTLIGIGIIGKAGAMKAKNLGKEGDEGNKEFNFAKGLLVAIVAGFMSACFAIGLGFGQDLCFADTRPIFRALPAIAVVTLGGFLTNAVYCLYQNAKNATFADYRCGSGLWTSNALLCALAGVLWYSQFFGLSLGQGILEDFPVLVAFSWCILMALNVVFSNLWGILLREWRGTTPATRWVLIVGIAILILSTFLPQIL
ncbi:MAG: rhamnose/proton symporter RhaT [Bacteroidales bacterium]|nr:rhamnose/proton symporter RhaT [Bacteroidales bacterium]